MGKQIRRSYLDETTLPFPFCPGCGHSTILESLDAALVQLQLDPHQTVVVSDIGCSGLSDRFYSTNAFHGLHGRSVTYATGIKLANPNLKVIVLMGDGGMGIGGHHVINAARRNVGVKVLVFNNFNYGMTGGQHSVTTPPGAKTATTGYGQLERPMDICGTVIINGANFSARTTTFNKDLPNLIADAISHPGFSLIDIWELCTAHFAPTNRFSKARLERTLKDLNFPTGIIHRGERKEFGRTMQSAISNLTGIPIKPLTPLETKYKSDLGGELKLVIAGAAGAKIVSAATALCRGAVLSGLWATQRNDYPVTVKAGHSIAELILSPKQILFSGVSNPDVIIVLHLEGLNKVKTLIGELSGESTLMINSELPAVDTQARKILLDFKKYSPWGRRKKYQAMIALSNLLSELEIFPLEALKSAVAINTEYAEENIAAINTTIS
ncbi:MAG: thiamine pyrophosphate-dependent enzyme [Anaerolineales bacterium]|jgi:pyruvate/2-oxoacid:ferredoxin oxidoreductase beta subunit/Pyruvate/2-oxoacid:ferredoxin oxidoreductase gamma subunit